MQRSVTGPSIAELLQRERRQWSAGGRGWMGKPRPFPQAGAARIDDPAFGLKVPPVMRISEMGVAVPQDPRPYFAPQPELGRLSASHESRRHGAAEVSSGRGDRGGVSYGIHQFSSRYGIPEDFLTQEGAPWAPRFRGTKSGSPAFSAAWKAVAREAPESFAAAQGAYSQREYYQGPVNHVHKATKLDLNRRSRAVREAVLSTGVQNTGGASLLLERAVKAADMLTARSSPNFDRILIERLYDYRSRYVADLARKARARGDLDEARGLENGVLERYRDERADALRMLQEERRSRR
jgi:hypothetical protein